MDRPGSLAEIAIVHADRPPSRRRALPVLRDTTRRNPSTPDAIVPIARFGPSPCFWAWAHTLATASGGSARKGSHHYPHAGRDEQRVRFGPCGLRSCPDKPLQRGEFVALGALVGRATDHRQVVPSQRVADRCA